jgi:hypothetical protein
MKRKKSHGNDKRTLLRNFVAEQDKDRSSSEKWKTMLYSFDRTFRPKQGS